jgi:ABC-type Fe3+ transport system permease subunit
MMRLLLAPIAVLTLFAALLPLGVAAMAGGRGLAASLADPRLLPAMRTALAGAALVTALAVPLGLLLALSVWRAARPMRGLALAFCVVLLAVPAPGFADLGFLAPPRPAAALAFGCAVARGAAFAVLILAAGLGRVPPGLQTAARAAGAGPVQAWRHAVLAPLAWPLLGAAALAFAVGLAEGPAAAVLAPHFDLADSWIAPASLLLAAASVAALAVLGRRDGSERNVLF